MFSLSSHLAALALLSLFATNVQAQTPAPVKKLAKAMTDSLSYLQLTDKQETSIEQLNETAASSLIQTGKKAKTDTSFKGKALTQQVAAIMKQRNAAIQPILTPDQQKLFQQHKIQQIADIQTKSMAQQLDLTDAQIPQVHALNLKETAETMQDMQKLQNAKGKLSKLKAAKSLKGDAKDKDKALKGILSPNQYAIYEKNEEQMQEAMKAEMKEKKQ